MHGPSFDDECGCAGESALKGHLDVTCDDGAHGAAFDALREGGPIQIQLFGERHKVGRGGFHLAPGLLGLKQPVVHGPKPILGRRAHRVFVGFRGMGVKGNEREVQKSELHFARLDILFLYCWPEIFEEGKAVRALKVAQLIYRDGSVG